MTEQNAPSVLYEIQDDSLSNRGDVAKELGQTGTLIRMLDHQATFLVILRSNSRVEEVFGSPLPASARSLFEQIVPKLSEPSRTDGTRLDLALSNVADRATSATGRVVVLIQTDYATEFSDHKVINDAAKKLGANPHVKAVFVEGAEARFMWQLRKDLKPLAHKLQVVNAGKLDLALVANLLSGGQR